MIKFCYFIYPRPLTAPSSSVTNCAASLSTEVCSVQQTWKASVAHKPQIITSNKF